MWHNKNNQKISSPILEEIFVIIFLQDWFYPDVEMKKSEKHLTDIKAEKGFAWADFYIV